MNKITYLECTKTPYSITDSRKDKYDNYQINDCILVRTTNGFPFNKIIETPKNSIAYEYDKSSIMGEAIINELRKTYKNLDLIEEARKYNVCFKNLRTTIHFTINGLVSSHIYGNFENRPYIIIDPLKYHLKNKSLQHLGVEDTYFNDELTLSEEAAILIIEKKYNEIKNNPEYMETLSQLKVFVYKGNPHEAIQKTLNLLGYDSFIINNHGYVNGLNDNTAANKMYTLINRLNQKYNLNNEKHFYSSINIEDLEKTNEEGKKTDMDHFLYIINNSNIPKEIINKINEAIEKDKTKHLNLFNNYIEEDNKYLKQIIPIIIEIIGLDKIKNLTAKFNTKFIKNLKKEKNISRK